MGTHTPAPNTARSVVSVQPGEDGCDMSDSDPNDHANNSAMLTITVCGNNRPATKADDEDCDMPCTGDDEQPCGSANRLTVYTSDLMAPAAAGWQYSGCYADSTAKRVLTVDYYADAEDMTPETCIEFCEDGKFKYAGVEYGAECCKSHLPH